MNPIDPDDEASYFSFLWEWKTHYTARNPIKPPSIDSMRILYQYATSGSIPGEFIMAVLQNHLYDAFNLAPMTEIKNDDGSRSKISEIDLLNGTIQYITTYLPIESWGSADKVAKFINQKKKGKHERRADYY